MYNNFIKSLNEELSLELHWRYIEIYNIKCIYKDNIELEKKFNKFRIKLNRRSKFILRTSILILYAHWEGYFKFCLKTINNKLDLLNVDLNELDNSLLSILYKDKHTIDYKKRKILFEEINIDTGANLDWKRLEKLLSIYNFNKKQFEKYESEINKLVKIRNGIAHGENAYHFDNYKSISKYVKIVLELMLMTRLNSINFFKLNKYKKKL
jgi:hypothetical protein